jgi:large subunit ribosomal protein L9
VKTSNCRDRQDSDIGGDALSFLTCSSQFGVDASDLAPKRRNKTMEVILLERVSRLGQMGDTVKVKDGFARNFLLPQGKALRANEANKKKFEGQRAQLEARNLERKSEATQVSEKLDGKSFIAVRSAGETGQLYGSVSTRDIAELLTAEGFSVNRNQILLNQPIKTIGLTNVAIALHPEVEVTITLNIARTADEAERQAKGETLTTAEAIYGDDINDNARPDNFFDPNAEFEGGEDNG